MTLMSNKKLICWVFFQLEKVEFTFIGPEWGDDAEGGNDENGGGHGDDDGAKGKNVAAANNSGNGGEKKPKSATQLEGEEMVGELVAATEGLMCTMEVLVSRRATFYEVKVRIRGHL